MIYVIGPSIRGPLKIGKAKDPSSRLRQLQTGHPEKLHVLLTGWGEEDSTGDFYSVPDSLVEKAFHHKFRNARMNGEWFNITTEDICCEQWFDDLPASITKEYEQEVGIREGGLIMVVIMEPATGLTFEDIWPEVET